MSYRTEDNQIVIDGFEKGIASSPYYGIGNMSNLNNSYYPGVAYVNYRRQASTLNDLTYFYAGTHSTNVSGNSGWLFTAPTVAAAMTNPVQKATSPLGLNYILDDTGQIWKQSAVNSSTFNKLGGGTGRVSAGHLGLAFWNNYLVVFGSGYIEFCGDGTGDSAITASNWNKTLTGTIVTAQVSPSGLIGPGTILPNIFQVNDPVTFTTTGTLPSPLIVGTTYYIKSLVAAGIFQISATVGGSAVAFTDTGSGIHTMNDNVFKFPVGNCTNLVYSGGQLGDTTMTIVSYVRPNGTTQNVYWAEPTGIWAIVDSQGTEILGTFTNGSSNIRLLSAVSTSTPGSNINILNTTAISYRAYVSKSDGNLYFCNGRWVGRISTTSNPNTKFNPASLATYSVNYAVTGTLQTQDTVVDMTDLSGKLVFAGNFDIYPWDYVSAQPSASNPVGEQIYRLVNLLNNIYILAGSKGNVYSSNGYATQLYYKMSDFIAGAIDPVWLWGDLMVYRSKLFFQALGKTVSGTNVLAGIFSLVVSPPAVGNSAEGLVMESQNSYGLTPASGALQNGILIDNEPWSTGIDSYYSAWSNGASTGGIDYNDNTLWQNFEPTIETDIIPIGTIKEKGTLGHIEFKLDRPMASGDQIRMYWRPSLTNLYTLMGTTTTAQLSDYYPSNINQAQWVQFKIQYKCASSSSSFIPLREIRLHIT